MDEQDKMVPLREAMQQVETGWARLTLLHLAFCKTLIDELGIEKGEEMIVKVIIEYSKRVVEGVKRGAQRLPFYGLHEKYVYSDREYLDNREIAGFLKEGFDWSLFKNYGCIIAKLSKEYGEEEHGRLYCYADPGISMAANPNCKFIHRKCEICGDEYCAFEILPTTEKERADFREKANDWKYVDPCLAEGANRKP